MLYVQACALRYYEEIGIIRSVEEIEGGDYL